jgi:hypothetical protein
VKGVKEKRGKEDGRGGVWTGRNDARENFQTFGSGGE